MASRTPFNFPRFRAFDSNGDPLSGGKVYFYEAGTTTAKTTWSDPDLTVANTQPVVLDSAGEADIYLNDQAYKIVLDDADDVQQWTLDEYVRNTATSVGNADPPHATDSGTDAFTGNSGLTLATGEVYTWDFQSANTTTTPTLNDNSQGAKTIKTRDGSALWAGAINGVHRLEYNGTDYLLLDPVNNIPPSTDLLDEDDMASDSATAVPTQQSTKAYVDTTPLQKPGTSSDPGLAFDTWRTPNANRPTEVVVEFQVETDGTSGGQIIVDVDESGGTAADYNLRTLIGAGAPAGTILRAPYSFKVPAGGSYQIRNDSDPSNTNAISTHREYTL